MESSGPFGLVKNDENSSNATARQTPSPAAKCQMLSGGALTGGPLASRTRFQTWFNPSARTAAAKEMTKVSFVAAMSPRPAPADSIQPNFRVRQYLQPDAIVTSVKKTRSISWIKYRL